MTEQTFKLRLKSWLASALLETLTQTLQQTGFQKMVEAGEVGGVESSVWQRGDEMVTITVEESEMEEGEMTVIAEGLDGAGLLGASAVQLAQAVLASVAPVLPPERHLVLQNLATELNELAISLLPRSATNNC